MNVHGIKEEMSLVLSPHLISGFLLVFLWCFRRNSILAWKGKNFSACTMAKIWRLCKTINFSWQIGTFSKGQKCLLQGNLLGIFLAVCFTASISRTITLRTNASHSAHFYSLDSYAESHISLLKAERLAYVCLPSHYDHITFPPLVHNEEIRDEGDCFGFWEWTRLAISRL